MNHRFHTPLLSAEALRWLGLGLALSSALALLACASAPPPTDQLAVATAAVAHAATAGGPEMAPLEMGLARDKLARARQALAAGDNAGALALAQQAQLDAQLAESKAETLKARQSAAALQESDRVLREEMARKKP